MGFAEEFKKHIHLINEGNFHSYAVELFKYQYNSCEVYKKYCDYLSKKPDVVRHINQIPFLPIQFFKNHVIKSGNWETQCLFKSSGTTNTRRSIHHIKDTSWYLENTKQTFESKVGKLNEFQILALLPSYQEQGDSSLLAMVDYFLQFSSAKSGYFLNKDGTLKKYLSNNQKKLLIGVSYALLDLAEESIPVQETIVMETGGMKGRRKEMIRSELHSEIKKGLGTEEIWSEYGMTELFSQAYGKAGYFEFPPWASVLVRDINDPLNYVPDGKSGGINIIDLANVDTCAFIETSDLGRVNGNKFEVLGRFDNSDIRGCNLLI